MIELNGKYNSCKVFTGIQDEYTTNQIIRLLDQESMKNERIRIMPNCYMKDKSIIGLSTTITDKVIPSLLGSDIGCGVLAIKIDQSSIDLDRLNKIIDQHIPTGSYIHDHIQHSEIYLSDITAPINTDIAYRSLGTLDGNSHFIEIDQDTDHNYWLVIHTGSRNLGVDVSNYYRKLASSNLDNKSDTPKDLCYLEGTKLDAYLHDVNIVQNYASANRMRIADEILFYMRWSVFNVHETLHNYIDTSKMILHNGSVSAEINEQFIIPISSNAGCLLCTGNSIEDWNYSTSSSARRLLNKSKAREVLTIDEYQESMVGVYTTSITESNIDEAPLVYEPMYDTINNISDTVTDLELLKPIYNKRGN